MSQEVKVAQRLNHRSGQEDALSIGVPGLLVAPRRRILNVATAHQGTPARDARRLYIPNIWREENFPPSCWNFFNNNKDLSTICSAFGHPGRLLKVSGQSGLGRSEPCITMDWPKILGHASAQLKNRQEKLSGGQPRAKSANANFHSRTRHGRVLSFGDLSHSETGPRGDNIGSSPPASSKILWLSPSLRYPPSELKILSLAAGGLLRATKWMGLRRAPKGDESKVGPCKIGPFPHSDRSPNVSSSSV